MDQFLIKKDPTGTFKRPQIDWDMKYRRIQKATFAEKLAKIFPKSTPLCFHGTTIWNTQEILQSGNISAEIDRKGNGENVLNMPGKISVTTIKDLWWTVKEFADLANFDYPAGCIFVLEAKSDKEFESAQNHKTIDNVDLFSHSARLKSIITTPENISRVKGWLKNSNVFVSPEIVVDYETFLKECERSFEKEKTI